MFCKESPRSLEQQLQEHRYVLSSHYSHNSPNRLIGSPTQYLGFSCVFSFSYNLSISIVGPRVFFFSTGLFLRLANTVHRATGASGYLFLERGGGSFDQVLILVQ